MGGSVTMALLSLHQVLVTVRSTYFIGTIVENVQFGVNAFSKKGLPHLPKDWKWRGFLGMQN